ncbi:electron transfer flavoprotein subunit alpha/FixB family protein [Syntrophomonas wolfei]|jgi:electron transfer flavoprotein alpha subunit|uniref:electron transfer flavoprotein subunit alpha/FixB family protein n=3 Tax=Syntrophomonas wolfei TaxID=863 RepID=UPI0023EFC4E1|nr:electron transfer flavoprotein subunit alpha/FixB family protein [Syntrophomonas wolfei]
MAGILIYSENTNLALELLAAARTISESLKLAINAVAINDAKQAVEMTSRGADIFLVCEPDLLHADAGAVAYALQQVASQNNASIILLASNRRGKELAGRLAQEWGAGCLSDVKGLSIENETVLCERNVLGGAAVAVQKIKGIRQVIAISPRAFSPDQSQGEGKLIECKVYPRSSSLRLLETLPKATDRVKIEEAEVLVVVGQGVESKESLTGITAIAKALGGEIACSKPVASDKKWLGEERIVGLSGKICKPQLAIILGVSGQVQFTVGIRDAGTIISINNDEKALMNNMADYVMIADLKEVLPDLNKALG